jgi:polysaccharide pyruvyl transferase WcaK-like protein
MRIGLITTLNTNIGDDFIREGICLVLREVFNDHHLEFVAVNKHDPLMVYPRWHPIHSAKLTRHLPRGRSLAFSLIERYASKLRLSYFDRCDLIVQCGAPVLWPGCHRCEWSEPLWHHIIGRLSRRVPVLNLAAGSCYPWERQPTNITDGEDAEYLRAILGYCDLTTVRDNLAQRLCVSLGAQAPLLPCSAFLAGLGHGGATRPNGMVLINYMSGGGHYEWDQGIDPSAWRATVTALIARLRTRHKLAFLCHNEAEYGLARELDAALPCLFPKTPQEYFSVVAEAKAALCNRMHASIGLAGLGVPSVAVCTDTRLLMVDTIGLPCVYVKEAEVNMLEQEIEKLLAQRVEESERLLALRSETFTRYVKIVSDAICRSRIEN